MTLNGNGAARCCVQYKQPLKARTPAMLALVSYSILKELQAGSLVYAE